jgi:transposase
MVRRDSSLSDEQREAAVALFESGYGRDAVATSLGVSSSAVRHVHDRWRIWGRGALVAKSTKQTYAFDLKCEVVQRFLAGETLVSLAQEYALSSPKLVEAWVRIYRVEGEDGLHPKPKGRPKRDPGAPVGEESELERLRRENERLRAEVAFLGKLKALMSRERP